MLPANEDDDKNTVLEIRPAAGGQEAQLFAMDLFEMYRSFAGYRGWRFEELAVQMSDLGGLREGVALISGAGAFGFLKHESGVHRVQRVPSTESYGRVHTSTVTVAIMAERKDADIAISDKDLRVDVYRSSGAGGQHVNTTESAVRVTHLPTNIVVCIQDERSQHRNKAKALKILQARLYDMEQQKLAAERSEHRREQVGTGARSERVRTYNYPQSRVSDHRSQATVRNLDVVLEGGEALDELIETVVRWDNEERLKAFLQDQHAKA
mmetsp:Transcript_10937/g.30693  ORF Transcript_10937/g.30693 Transcript_10937/m.30693 type:complete len:267 (+) Transcript_10937:155-955(+)